MSEEEYRFLKWLTFGTYNELFEVIDDDGIRKPAIRTKISNVEASPKGYKNFNCEHWTLEIDWRLVGKIRKTCGVDDERAESTSN
ncbi:hypothetical protein IKD67_01865 [Candidatus Saccharibacteria bacterium]|nr:hypothetical protein [Candidatus Saccharibacteria bacterium]